MSELVPFTPAQTLKELEDIGAEKLEKLGFSAKGQEDFKSYVYEAKMWTDIASSITPPDIVEIREGNKDKNGNPMYFEYFPEEYALGELNRLFPGWCTENMQRSSLEEIIKLECVIVEGNLIVPYVTPNGNKVRRIWAIAGDSVTFRTGTKVPVDLPNNFKGARTYWLRIACKWLGIGLDLYHQKITPELRRLFEDRIRIWGTYADHWKGVAKNSGSGKSFRILLRTMPSEVQVERIAQCMPYIPASKHAEVWTNFGKLSNANDASKKQFEEWISKVEEIAERNKKKKGE